MTTYRLLARRGTSPATDEPTSLYRFLLLSMLLHAVVVAVFGQAGGSGPRRGDGASGVLDVTLRRLSPEPGAGFRLAPGAEPNAAGASILQRLGPTRRAPTGTAPAPPRQEPARARPIAPQPRPVERPPAPFDTAAPTPPEAAPVPTPSTIETLPAINRNAPEEVDKPLAPSAPVPPKVDAAPAPPPPREAPVTPAPPVERTAPPIPQREIVPPSEPAPRELPTMPNRSAERVEPPRVEREVAPLAEPQPRELPTRPEPPAPVESIAPSRMDREIVTPVEPIAPIAPAKIEREIGTPVERRAPADATSTPERVAPQPRERETTPATTMPSPGPVPSAPRVERVAPPATAPGRSAAPTRAEPPTGEPAPRLRLGAPDPGDEIFTPRGGAISPTSPAGSTPRIDLEATRQRAREITSEGSGYRGVVPLAIPPPPPDRKSKLGEAIEKAVKPDCRDAHAEMGLLAIPGLVASAIGNGACRW